MTEYFIERKFAAMAAFVIIQLIIPSIRVQAAYYVATDGDDNNDGTQNRPFATIQKGVASANDGALGQYAVVYIRSGIYRSSPIIIPNNNTRIIFDKDVTVRALSLKSPAEPNNPNTPFSFAHPSGSLFNAVNKKNIIFDGNETTFEMNKNEYLPLKGEGRMGISLYGCSDISISGLNIKNTGGDGIYITGGNPTHFKAAGNKNYCENITIRNIICDNSYRNGISVISVDGLTIENCILKNTKGTNPQAGIDFEPFSKMHRLKNIVMRNCRLENNKYGIIVSPEPLDGQYIDILIEDCLVTGNVEGLFIYRLDDKGPKGIVIFKNVTVEDCNKGVFIYHKSSLSASIIFNNCVWRNFRKDSSKYPIEIWDHGDKNNPKVSKLGGVQFIDCRVFDNQNRPAVKLLSGPSNLYDIFCDLRVYNPLRADNLYDWGRARLHNVSMKIKKELVVSDANSMRER